jgi:hypothetical protein
MSSSTTTSTDDARAQEALNAITAATGTLEGAPRPSEMEGLPVEVVVNPDGTSRHATLLDYLEKDNEELTEAGWTPQQVNDLVQRMIALFEATESDEAFLAAGASAKAVAEFRKVVAHNFTIIKEESGLLRFASRKDQAKALAVRDEFEPNLLEQLSAQGYTPEGLTKVREVLFEGRTADEPAVVPDNPTLFGVPADQLSDEVPEIIDEYADAMEEHWGF